MSSRIKIKYEPRVEEAITEIEALLQADYQMSKRIMGLLLLQGDAEILKFVQQV